MEPTNIDPLLQPLLEAGDEEQRQKIIEPLLAEHLDQIIEQVVWRKLSGRQYKCVDLRVDFADLKSEIIVKILGRLTQLRTPPTSPIVDLRAYVAGIAYSCCADYFRQHFPHRHHHKNRIRYLLTHKQEFCLLPHAELEWVGGLSRWGATSSAYLSRTQFEQLIGNNLPAALQGIPDPTLKRKSPVTQVSALFEWANSFIGLDDLVAILAAWWQVQDARADVDTPALTYHENLLAKLESRAELQLLWREIVQLPVRQRQALLLGLQTSEQTVLLHFPVFQIASLVELAAALEFHPAALAEIWNQLPLSDKQIADRLGATRQQVINLRQAAREKLSRRLKKK